MIYPYNREKAVAYAHTWALRRNPRYLDFEKLGGDCTNFISQSLHAGSGVMNYVPVYGWYYVTSEKRTASWTGVDFLYNFLTGNKGPGPFGEKTGMELLVPGDLIQLSFRGEGSFQHSLMVVEAGQPASVDNIKIATHTDDQDWYPLTSYTWEDIRCLKILGVRR